MNTDVLLKIKENLKANLPKSAKAMLYGSRARGTERSDSDWDILILLNKDTLTQSDYREFSFPLVCLGWDIDQTINPIMYTTKEWDTYKITPFYENVNKDAINLL